MSVFENIDHAKISTILLSLWGVTLPVIAGYIFLNQGIIIAILSATIGVKYSAIIGPIILSLFLIWYNQHYPGVSMPTDGA